MHTGVPAPFHRVPLEGRTLAGAQGRPSQLHSAFRQTAFYLEIEHPPRYQIRVKSIPLEGMPLGQRRAGLQGTGQAASAPHTRTHAFDLSVSRYGLCI